MEKKMIKRLFGIWHFLRISNEIKIIKNKVIHKKVMLLYWKMAQ